MKQLKLMFAFGLMLFFVACSNEPKLMTEAEFAKKVADETATKTKALEAKLDEECSSGMDAMVKSMCDSIVMAKKAETALPTAKKK